MAALAWLPLTEAIVLRTKAAAFVSAARTKALGASQADPLPEIITQVTREIRIEISACQSNRLDADETLLPPELLALAGRMAVRELRSRINAVAGTSSAVAMNDQEKEEWRQDVRKLERIAACTVLVSEPLSPTPSPVQGRSVLPKISGPRREFRRCQQEGI